MFESITPLFFGLPGGPEMLVVLLLVVLLFGADRLPKLARSSGQAMGEFRRGREAVEAEIRGAHDRALADDETVDTVTEAESA
ncbi:Sec-independent protein translocase subunit TatA/TatB [Haloglomus halophilum]|jgi:sec-independent protein translocase protein TatA|uniref:Sec-independent protein translocase subunit TatA/TatB n=1 Tax=Haloglomus halophilum TaxID=2962672 RepID=UPI0020C94E24|nr:twin-arginine translocase TatA/TatE family subunit [Haloglomus halophilum]